MKGQELFDALAHNTGLPDEYVRLRLQRLLASKSVSIDSLELEDVRELLSDLLLDLIHQTSEA